MEKKNLPQLSAPNQTSMCTSHKVISGRMMQMNSRRRIGQISVHKILMHLLHNTQESALEAWKDRANHLNNRSPYASEDENVRKNSTVEFQYTILNISYGNLEKCFYQQLCISKRLTNNAKKKNGGN